MAIRPSLRLVLLLLISHLAAVAVVLATDIPGQLAALLLVAILSSLSFHLARDALLVLPASWLDLSLERDGVAVVRRDGGKLAGRIAPTTLAHPFFVLLRIEPEGRRGSLARIILPDALGREAFRELCVRLRLPRE